MTLPPRRRQYLNPLQQPERIATALRKAHTRLRSATPLTRDKIGEKRLLSLLDELDEVSSILIEQWQEEESIKGGRVVVYKPQSRDAPAYMDQVAARSDKAERNQDRRIPVEETH